MQITINHIQVEVLNDETILEAARRAGYTIPSLCEAKGAQHKSSCMVCAVKNCATGQILPSCTTPPEEGMQLETDSEEVRLVRSLSLELLLSDHRADCEAPCTMVCPEGLDVERVLACYDNEQLQEAFQTIAGVFALPEVRCETCKAPCEKACRRGTIDRPVSIRDIIRQIAQTPSVPLSGHGKQVLKPEKKGFQSRLGRFSENEKRRLKETVTTPSRCLHCACAGRTGCKLRLYATSEGIRRPRYSTSSVLPAMNKIHVSGNMWFEQAKCIRCGLCVYNSKNGFTFKGRGFGMQIILPEENRLNIMEELAALCPTGALYLTENSANG